MALRPQDRYSSAQDLAEDLEHWLADEPVQAYPEPVRARLARWARRHKPLVAGAAALLLTAVIALSLGLVLLGQANLEIEGQRDQAEKNLSQAQREHDQAIAHLYRSLVGEARAVRVARRSGYRGEAWKLLEQASRLPTPEKDINQLRLEAVAFLGDFLGLEPTVWAPPAGAVFRGIALQPGGALLALVVSGPGASNETLLRDVATGREVARLREGNSGLLSRTFSADGQRLFAGDATGAVRVWQARADGSWGSAKSLPAAPQLGSFVTPSPFFPFFVSQWEFTPMLFLAVSPDGKRLAGRHMGGRGLFDIPVWDLTDGTLTTRFAVPEPVPAGTIYASRLAFSPRGDLLATGLSRHSGGNTSSVLVWDTATHRLKMTLHPDLGDVFGVSFSPDGKNMACACTGGVAVFDTTDYQRRLFMRADYPSMAAFSPDSRLLALPGRSAECGLWDIVTNREVAVLRNPGELGTRYAAFTSDGKRLITASSESVRIWQLAGAQEKRRFAGHDGGISGLAFSPDGKVLASAGKDKTVRLWDPASGKIVRELRSFDDLPQSATFSPDARLLTITEWQGGVNVWDVRSGRKVATSPATLGPGHYAANFSPDGRWYMVCGGAGVKIWSVLHAEPASRAASASGASRVASAPGARLALKAMPGPAPMEANSGCFSPDSKHVAWISMDYPGPPHLWIYDLATGQSRSWPANVFTFLALSWLPDSKHVVLVNQAKGEIEVRDTDTGEVTTAFGKKQLLAGESIHTALSGDGAWLAVGGSRPVSIWDMNKRELVVTLPKERGTIWSLAWSPDRESLAVGSSDGGLVIWNLPHINTELSRIGLGW